MGQHPAHGDIFSDNFDNISTSRWLDMKAWGFGVWQITDGKLISLDRENPGQQMLSILPKFDNAILNRDFSVLFKYGYAKGYQPKSI